MSTPPNLPEPPKDQHDEPAPAQQAAPTQQPYPPMPPQAPYPPYPPQQQPYPPQYGQPYATGQKTSGLAITGFVLSLLVPLLFWNIFAWILAWLGNLAGFIISIVAVSQIKNSNGQLGGKGLATAGIVLSCVWFGLLILFIILGVVASVAFMNNLDTFKEFQQFAP